MLGNKNISLLPVLALIISCSGNSQFNRNGVFFIDNEIDSIEEIFKIKNLTSEDMFIDIWSTSCRPCFESFEKTMKNRSLNKNLEVLYIVHDKGDVAKSTKLISKYKLKGKHLRISGEGIAQALLDEIIIYKAEKSGLPLNYVVKNGSLEKTIGLEEYFNYTD